jgi:hypothetical protein
LKLSLVGQLSKIFVTLPITINFRSQIENQVSDYRLMGASSVLNLQFYLPHLLPESILQYSLLHFYFALGHIILIPSQPFTP